MAISRSSLPSAAARPGRDEDGTGRHRAGPGRLASARTTMPAAARPLPALPAGRHAAAPAPSAASPRAGAATATRSAWTGRALRTLAGIAVLTWSFRLSGYLTFAPWLAIAVTVLGLAGLLAVIAAWLPGSVLDERRQRRIGWGLLVAALVALALWSYFQVYIAPDYGTDEIAFDQYAAQLAARHQSLPALAGGRFPALSRLT